MTIVCLQGRQIVAARKRQAGPPAREPFTSLASDLQSQLNFCVHNCLTYRHPAPSYFVHAARTEIRRRLGTGSSSASRATADGCICNRTCSTSSSNYFKHKTSEQAKKLDFKSTVQCFLRVAFTLALLQSDKFLGSAILHVGGCIRKHLSVAIWVLKAVYLLLRPFPAFRAFAAGSLSSRRFALLYQACQPFLLVMNGWGMKTC